MICLIFVRGPGHVVEGVVFDRYITIWLENTDFGAASSDRETLLLKPSRRVVN